MRPGIAFLVGRPWSRHSIFPSVVARLWAERARVAICGSPERIEPCSTDLVVLGALDSGRLVSVERLAGSGVRCCNTVDATRTAADRRTNTEALAAAGVPQPRTIVVERWEEVLAAGRESRAVVKPIAGRDGVNVLAAGRLPENPPFPGPYLVQDRVSGDGVDRKLFVVGDEVRGVLRRWPCHSVHDKLGAAFAPDKTLCELALRAGRALGLELYGVDVVVGPNGPVVVDVNALPGYKGVPDADELVARYLLHAARTAGEAACAR